MSVIDESWDFEFMLNSIEDNCYKDFYNKVECLDEHISKFIEDGFKIQKYNYRGSTYQTHDDELKNLIEANKGLQSNLDNIMKDLSLKKMQYESFKKDQKLLSQEIKETHEAFLMAKKWYKKYLKMYFTIESRSGGAQTIYLQFFTEAKKESETFSVKLFRDTKTGKYQLLDVTPKLKLFRELQERLQDTNDVAGALCCIRLAFLNVRKSKK